MRTNYLRKTIFITKFQIELFIHQCSTYQKKYESVANPLLEKQAEVLGTLAVRLRKPEIKITKIGLIT